MRKVIVTGFFKTVSPLHIAAPGSVRLDTKTGDRTYGEDGVPLTTIQTVGVPGVSKTVDSDGNVSEKQRVVAVPLVSANNLSGRGRRTIADVFLEALQTNGEKIDIHTYSAIKTGAATGSPDGVPISYDEYRRATDHPFLGLMGGGPRMIKRKVQIYNAVALCNESIDLLRRTKIPYSRIYGSGWENILALHTPGLSARNLIAIWTFRRTDDLRDLVNIAQAERSIESFEQAFAERQAAIVKEGNKNSVFTFQAMEFVVPGVSFPYVAVLNDPSDAQVGLWLSGFDRFCNNESIGGWSRNGFGEFVFEDGRLTVVDDGELTTERYSPTGFLDDDNSYRLRAVKAWNEAAASVTAKEIDWLMRLPIEKDKGKKKTANN